MVYQNKCQMVTRHQQSMTATARLANAMVAVVIVAHAVAVDARRTTC